MRKDGGQEFPSMFPILWILKVTFGDLGPSSVRIVYVYSIDFNTETTRTHPGPDRRIRLQYRF